MPFRHPGDAIETATALATRAPETIRLNLGDGGHEIPGFVGIDRMRGQEVYPLDYADGSVDEIRASHILEHFSHRQTLEVLREWIRVLKPGGVLKLAVPDFHWIAEKYLAGEDHPFMMYLFGGHIDENDRHGVIFDYEELKFTMEACGLTDVHPWTSEIEDCAALPVSLNLMGVKMETEAHADAMRYERDALTGDDFSKPSILTKSEFDRLAKTVDENYQPAPIPVGQLKTDIKAVCSSNRLMFADTMVSVFSALVPLGLNLKINTGVFWGQALTSMMVDHVADGTKYILTLDFDTLFSQADVVELYRLMELHPEIDALCSCQMRREGNTPLMTIESKAGKNVQTIDSRMMEADVMRINSAHFGLTMIRVDALNKATKPWFRHQPDEQGEWGPEHMDEDVYFWHNWKHSGLTLYQANRVAIGHLQLMATWPTRSLTPTFQFLKDWYSTGKPAEAFI